MKIFVPTIPYGANQMLKMNVFKRNREVKKLKTDTFLLWCEAGKPTFERPELHAVIVVGTNRKRDQDNYTTGSLKAIIDGLSGHAWADDNSDVLRIARVVIVNDGTPGVEIRVRERE